MAEHFVQVKGGDRVLIDLGEYGLEIFLDTGARFYDLRYVTIEYRGGDAIPTCLPADVLVMKGARTQAIRQADGLRIWRHGEGEGGT